MKINIIIDNSLGIDFKKLDILLNEHSETLKFKVYENAFDSEDDYIVFPSTHSELYSQLNEEEKSSYFNFIFTDIPYRNNYFFEGYDNLVPFSLFDWDYLTNLPLENGILYFIVNYLSRRLENTEFRHQENTGCIYDFLGNKKGVDDGMRQASFCKNCLETLGKQILSESDQKLLNDLKALMDLLSNSSKWNKNILEKIEDLSTIPKTKRNSRVPNEINVVIASPGDLIEERELLLNKLERKFRLDKHEELCSHRLIIHGWEDLSSQNGYAQNVINEQIICKMDIVLAVFKHKLGTPTLNQDSGKERAPSGTAEELLIALDEKSNKNPLGMVYFHSKPPSPPFDAENYDRMKSEWDRLTDFKKSIQNKVIYKPFTAKEELIDIVSKDIMNNVKNLFETQK